MLIGIDMLGVQSVEAGERASGRLGLQLVKALLARDPVNRYVLYTHESLPTRKVPSARNALRVSLASAMIGSSKLRPTIQRVLDQNPDGLDWLLLLDPFDASYGGTPPEAPLNGLRVASLITDLAPTLADDRRLVPLRRHDAILAVSEATAADCRRRLGSASWRVKSIGVACDESFVPPDLAEPLTRSVGDELARLGIAGPFLFASMAGGTNRANLGGVLDAYHRLPFEHRKGHQLVIAGMLDDPWGVVGYLHEQGCAEGLVLVGEVGERTLMTLYGRCAAFLSPSIEEGSGLSLIEAMRCGAPVVAARAGAQPEIVGDAGLLVDPFDPSDIADQLASLLGDVDLERELREKALVRSARFSWDPVVEEILAVFQGVESASPRPRIRFDRAHVARPRIAVFPNLADPASAPEDLADQVPAALLDAYGVDLYLESSGPALIDELPPEFGGFDTRQFERNDGILSYHAVVYHLADAIALEAASGRLRNRPGLVILEDQSLFDPIDSEPDCTARAAHRRRDHDQERATSRLREVFLTSSRVAVRSPRHLERIKASMPEFTDQIVEIPPARPPGLASDAARRKRRAELDLLPGSLVVGVFGPSAGIAEGLTTDSLVRAIRSALPGAMVFPFDELAGWPSSLSRHPGTGTPSDDRHALAILDLAIHLGSGTLGAVSLLDLLREGVPTIALGSDFPESVIRSIKGPVGVGKVIVAALELVSDPAARLALGRSARDHALGSPDPSKASEVLISEVERCSAELSRGPGRPRRRPEGRPIGLTMTPHSLRPASPKDEAVSRSR